MARYPVIMVFVTVVLMAIGAELIVQGFGYDFEAVFNLLLILAILLFAVMQYRRDQRAGASNPGKNS